MHEHLRRRGASDRREERHNLRRAQDAGAMQGQAEEVARRSISMINVSIYQLGVRAALNLTDNLKDDRIMYFSVNLLASFFFEEKSNGIRNLIFQILFQQEDQQMRGVRVWRLQGKQGT